MTITFPSRSFSFILDTTCLTFNEILPAFYLISFMRKICPELTVELSVPSFMSTQKDLTLLEILDINFNIVNIPPNFKNIELNESIDFNQDHERSIQSLTLLSLSDYFKSDGIITDNAMMIGSRYPIYQYHYIRIIPLYEFSDIIDIIAHGNALYYSASSALKNLPFDVFYQFTHFKNKRFFSWFNKIRQEPNNFELIDNLRSALLNRYPYILYSRDMIRFYELQRDYCLRRGERRFHLMLGYYLSNYYLLLWGMLDHLTLIAKYAYSLSVNEKYCGINRKEFWKEFRHKEPSLFKFIKEPSISEWITIMAEMRHHAAHKGIKIPSRILIETDESNMSYEDILEIIRSENNENDSDYQLLSEDYIKKVREPILVDQWRMSKMTKISESMVSIKINDRTILRDPILSVDYDLERLNAIIDAFITIMFNKIMEITAF